MGSKPRRFEGGSEIQTPIGSHGTSQVYFPDPWMVDFYGFHVGEYTSPMDPMGNIKPSALEFSWSEKILYMRTVKMGEHLPPK